MENKYIIWGAIMIFSYILTSAIVRIYKDKSDGNSIKQEVSLAIQNVSFFFEGIWCIISVYLATKFNGKIILPLFYTEIALIIIVVFMFITNLIRCLKEYILYQKIGSNWYLVAIQFINTIVISYLVYNYYIIYIQ